MKLNSDILCFSCEEFKCKCLENWAHSFSMDKDTSFTLYVKKKVKCFKDTIGVECRGFKKKVTWGCGKHEINL